MVTVLWILLLLAAGALLTLAPRWGLLEQWRRRRRLRDRTLYEDALKHLHEQLRKQQPATIESLAGVLRLSQKKLVGLIARLTARGAIRTSEGGYRLTAEGERSALKVVRAHRLWERYLADEAGLPLGEVHGVADRVEHTLTPERLDALEAHLGHPQRDPHGDPIPRADGTVAALGAVPLTDWPTREKAYIIHVEDEPEFVLNQILELGLTPGTALRILERTPEGMIVSDGEQEYTITPAVAANIHVRATPVLRQRPPGAITLAELKDGEAEVVGIAPNFRGFARRRLLDMGLTPGARIQVELSNAFGDPRAYRVRGTVIALRREQASLIWIRPLDKRSLVENSEVALP